MPNWPVPGIVYARHYFALGETAAGSTLLVQGEEISGVLTSAFFGLVERSEPGFVVLNDALKRRVEEAQQQWKTR